MSARHISEPINNAIASRGVARRPNKIKADTEVVHITFLLDADTARQIETERERRNAGDPDGRSWTRTDVIKSLLRKALGDSK